MGESKQDTLFVLCECHSPDHQLIFNLDVEDSKWVECWVTIHLSKFGFLKRLWHGAKYIFGYQSRYGSFQETIIPLESAKKIKVLLGEYIQAKEKSGEKNES